jgi:hypothetical protein
MNTDSSPLAVKVIHPAKTILRNTQTGKRWIIVDHHDWTDGSGWGSYMVNGITKAGFISQKSYGLTESGSGMPQGFEVSNVSTEDTSGPDIDSLQEDIWADITGR